MDGLYLARMGNMEFQCQPEMVGALSIAGYDIYRYVEVKLTTDEIAEIVEEQKEIYATN